MRDPSRDSIDKFDNIIHHYETIAWQVTSIFIAATAILISSQSLPSFFLYFLGLSIALSAVLFNISFRRRQHFYICAKREILGKIQEESKKRKLEEREKLELIINDCFKKRRVDEWIYYLILLLFIISYWLYRLFWWINNSYLNLIPHNYTTKLAVFFISSLISALLSIIFKNLGDFDKSQYLFWKSKRTFNTS